MKLKRLTKTWYDIFFFNLITAKHYFFHVQGVLSLRYRSHDFCSEETRSSRAARWATTSRSGPRRGGRSSCQAPTRSRAPRHSPSVWTLAAASPGSTSSGKISSERDTDPPQPSWSKMLNIFSNFRLRPLIWVQLGSNFRPWSEWDKKFTNACYLQFKGGQIILHCCNALHHTKFKIQIQKRTEVNRCILLLVEHVESLNFIYCLYAKWYHLSTYLKCSIEWISSVIFSNVLSENVNQVKCKLFMVYLRSFQICKYNNNFSK